MPAPPEPRKSPLERDALGGAKADGNDRTVRTAENTLVVKRPGDPLSPGGCPTQEGAAGQSGLPCLNSNKCTETTLSEGLNRLSTTHRKTAFALAMNVGRLCSKYGVERIGFLTLTFADHVTCAKEAGRRFKSLRTHVLVERYTETICVLERMKSGRIHFHLLVVLADDIRTGFNFDQAAAGVYSSANTRLRAEWAYWRSTARNYGFGRTELMPVKSNEEGLSKYVGKYIAKHIGNRETRDKGVRLVRYSAGATVCSTRLSWNSPRAKLWRWQVGEFCKRHGCSDTDALKAKFGPQWAYWQRVAIMALEPPQTRAQGETEKVTMWDVWHGDRAALADKVSVAVGCSHGDAYTGLFLRGAKPTFEYTVPVFSGVSYREPPSEEVWERTIIWNDGRVTRV